MHKEPLARGLGELEAPEWMRSLSYLWVYPAYDAGRMLAEERYVARIRGLGYKIRSFGFPCPEGWWDFPKLDKAWKSRSPELMPHYEILADLLSESDVLMSAGGSMVHPGLLEQFPAYSLFLCGDDPESSHRLSQPLAPHFDHCFPLNVASLEDYPTWGAKRVDWIFHPLRPDFQNLGISVQTILEGRRELDVTMFCERIHGLSDRAQRLERLQREFPQAHLRGKGWPGGFVSDSKIRQTYRDTKIGWNFHHSTGPCNSRMYMLPAFGVLQLCDNKDNLGRILDLDREVIGFDSLEECIEKTHYYLAHDEERREIAARGFERITRDFTEERHWTYILSKIEEGVLDKRQGSEVVTIPQVSLTAVPVEPETRPRVTFLADRPGWAYDIEAQNLARVLSKEYEVQIRYVVDRPDLSKENFDLLWVCFWGETWHHQFGIAKERIIKQVSSHRWRLDTEWGPLDPGSFVRQHLEDASTICAISQELEDAISPFRPCHRVQQGVDPARFQPEKTRKGPLRFGFAGNADDGCKGLRDILLPACGEDFELQIAGGEMDPTEMPAFYQDIDVLCIASTAEGGPLPLLEAMACACFPISTAVGIVPELVQHGQNGLIVDRAPTAFHAAMRWCIQNPEWVRQQAQGNAESIVSCRSWEQVAQGWKHVLDYAMQQLQAHPPVTPDAPISPKSLDSKARKVSVQASLKSDYAAHLARVNPAAVSEDTFRAASYYYEAEIASLLPTDSTAHCLELGCGFGHLLRWMHEKGFRDCSGVEIDEQVHAQAREYLAGRVSHLIRADALDYLRDCEEEFDLIIAFDFIEHFTLEEAHEVLTLIHARLREGGRVLLRTPNMANLFGIYSRYMDLTHRLGFTEQSLHQLLGQTGFGQVELVLPQWPEGHELSEKLEKSRAFHEQIFDLQDRSRPACFDKNLVLAASKLAPLPGIDKVIPENIDASIDEDNVQVSLEPKPRRSADAEAVMADSERPQILIIVDSPGWAHDNKTEALLGQLGGDFDIRKKYHTEVGPADMDGAELILVFYWMQLAGSPEIVAAMERNRDKLVVGICSHAELEGETGKQGIALLHEYGQAIFVHNLLLLTEWREVFDKPLYYTPNGVDLDFFRPSHTARRPGPLRVGWAGSLENFGRELRGFDLIAEACAELDGVEFLPAIKEVEYKNASQMRDWYQDLDVYICASRSEGTPNPCLEAAACGLPIVTTPVGNMPDYLVDGVQGFFIERRLESIQNALVRLRDDPQLRSRMALANLERIQDWSWARQAGSFNRLFQDCLAERATPV